MSLLLFPQFSTHHPHHKDRGGGGRQEKEGLTLFYGSLSVSLSGTAASSTASHNFFLKPNGLGLIGRAAPMGILLLHIKKSQFYIYTILAKKNKK